MATTWLAPKLQTVLDKLALLSYSSQTYSEHHGAVVDHNEIWKDTLAYPVAAAVASALILCLQLVSRASCVQKALAKASGVEEEDNGADDIEATGNNGQALSHVAELGGPIIYAFKVVRFLATLTLLALSIATVFSKDHIAESHVAPLWVAFGSIGIYAYASVLGFASLVSNLRLSRLLTRHLVTVLFATWLVYVYRDVWPLATFTLKPADASEGSLLWAKVAILSIASVVIPLLIPRQYIPVDPKEPSEEVNPEQTASILSMAAYTWLDQIIWKAYKIPHLPFQELPPLADYDRTKHLVSRAFPSLDPFQAHRKRHVFWGLIFIFRWEYVLLFVLILLRVFSEFANPVGVYYLLSYLETGGEGAVVRPWVWVLWLFFGPVIGNATMQYYLFNTTRILVRCEAIITQLVFDHALRIRMKAETANASTSSHATTAVQTPDNASVSGPEPGVDESSSDGTAVPATATTDAEPQKQNEEPTLKTESVPSENLIGKINNLVSTDLGNITDGRDFLFVVLYAPGQAALSIFFLYSILGWSALVGMISIIALFPMPGYTASKLQGVEQVKMEKTDARVQDVTETLAVIRMIKMFGWEPRVADRVRDKREQELAAVRKFKILETITGNLNSLIPIITMVATYASYTIIAGEQLTASRVFSSMTVFDLLRDQLHMFFRFMPDMVQAKVSLDRVTSFLDKTELLDQFDKKDAASADIVVPHGTIESDVIGIRGAYFTWSNDSDGSQTPGSNRRNFTLRIEDEVTFKRGRFNLILGPTGSGKTSLLMAILGEMHYIPIGADSYVSLPRAGGVAYAAQESWVQNETIRDNILFGSPFDEERYKKVLYQCALKPDLSLFDAGDLTEVGEKGLTLSGGQKARITLARAVYSRAGIVLLDDVLAALDVHTSRWIVEKCFQGDLLRGRTVILVTHNVALASPIADFVVSLGTDGRVVSQGTLSKALAKNHTLSKEYAEQREEIKKIEDEVDDAEFNDEEISKKGGDGKLVVSEEIAVGHVRWPAVRMYLSNMAGSRGHILIFWITLLGSLLATELFNVAQTWWLGYWAQQYEDADSGKVNVSYYLTVYNILIACGVGISSVATLLLYFSVIRASRSIHAALINSVLSASLRWLDRTPVSRIITRCTQDIQTMDNRFSNSLIGMLEITLQIVTKFLAVVTLSPIFTVPGVVVSAVGAWCGQIYMKAQLSVKREMSNAKAPVLGHFGAAISGLISIRAYGAQDHFRQEAYRRTDKYIRAARTFYSLNRWISIRVETLGALFASSLAAYLVYGVNARAANIGFSLNMAVGFSSMISWWVQMLNMFELNGNSLERIQQYLTIEHEDKPTSEGIPPAYWPASGSLRLEKLSARYSADGPRVLHDISFEVKAGERVGIVGRTGSGKSSLTLALLRLILTEGKVYFDGLATDRVNLDVLRSHITIIPQVPELLSGTLRENLDPFSQYDDAVLNDALRAAGLFSLQAAGDVEGRITLDSSISSAGGNLSVGQRQILALARAIVRQSKLLILDEATSAIDYETDEVIRKSLREELGKDVTLLTIAHRLQTIMDADKILVLDAGRIAEFGAPAELLKNEKGMLRALVDESADKDRLYEMVSSK